MSRSAWAGVLSSSLNSARYIAIRTPSRQSETAMLLIVRTLRRRLRKLFLRINDRFRNMAGPPQSCAFIEGITVARRTRRANVPIQFSSVQFLSRGELDYSRAEFTFTVIHRISRISRGDEC